MLNITDTDIKQVLVSKVFSAVQGGEEPRSVIERVKPVIEDALEKMLPDGSK